MIDVLRKCETRLEMSSGLVVNRGLEKSLVEAANESLFMDKGVIMPLALKPRTFGEEKRGLSLLQALRLAEESDLSQWGDHGRDYHVRHFHMIRYLVGKTVWDMRDRASSSSPSSVTVRIHPTLWGFGNPHTDRYAEWAHKRMCSAEMESMACGCIAYMILCGICVSSYETHYALKGNGHLEQISIEFAWRREK